MGLAELVEPSGALFPANWDVVSIFLALPANKNVFRFNHVGRSDPRWRMFRKITNRAYVGARQSDDLGEHTSGDY